jgi:opacity protein-like surface antigen
MKKICVLALATFVPLLASAVELSPGTIQLKGDTTIGYRSGSDETKYSDGSKVKTETTAFDITAQGLFFLAPGIGAGGVVSYLSQTDKQDDGTGQVKRDTTLLLVGPAVGVDYAVTPQVSLFGEGAVGYATGSQKYSGAGVTLTDTISMSGYGFEVAGGVKLFLERHFSFDVGLGYTYISLKNSDEKFGKPKRTLDSVGVNLGLSVYFGGK